MADSPTGTVTFLFTDIQGSTAMWERDAKRMQAVLARHDEIMKTTVSSHGGHVFKMIGDACCAAFPSAPHARQTLPTEGLLEPGAYRTDVFEPAFSFDLGEG